MNFELIYLLNQASIRFIRISLFSCLADQLDELASDYDMYRLDIGEYRMHLCMIDTDITQLSFMERKRADENSGRDYDYVIQLELLVQLNIEKLKKVLVNSPYWDEEVIVVKFENPSDTE